MEIYPHIAAEMHQYRSKEIRRATARAHMIAGRPRKTHSYRLGSYRLTLAKAATPQVPCTD